MKIRTGDEIKVVKGKDSGKTAKVLRVFTKDAKVIVEGINQYKRHIKARTQNQKSEIVTITKPMPMSNVAFICPKCKKMTRIGFDLIKGEKVRVCRKCGKEV